MWRFALVDPDGITDPTGADDRAADPGYDATDWREVAVPHDWSIEQTPTTDHGTTSGTGFLRGGLGWYRFGVVDTAGFPKDMYHLFRSQWTSEPMVHLLPMPWNHEAGDTVEVWAYTDVPSVELFLDGKSLGVREFDVKRTTDGRAYLETGKCRTGRAS